MLKSGPNSGERFACIEIEDHGIEVSIALEGETDYIDGHRYSQYDYDDVYLENGLAFGIFPDTETSEYLFGVDWYEIVDKHEVIK
ncbi:hypothetical protein HMPREF9257_0256 [Eremococcus coleocola ACS-139-V-Col8]|uniref:Uncharacterized protein n=1 Tax=Eremococcus coleocola ACS-139-V-Col8 TaxID=908337 RepID=E4KMF8_9LACT|nr:hypothetical protein HMPREF9257_0256 [Eremococcus coleocola ACS-139-V-Col8]